MDSCQRTMWGKHDFFQSTVIRDTGDDDFTGDCQISGCLGNQSTKLANCLCFFWCTIIHRQMVASIQQPSGHMTSHLPHTDKAYILLGILRPRHSSIPPFWHDSRSPLRSALSNVPCPHT